MFEFGPILRTLWRSKTGALLIIVQAALTLGIISNAAFVVHERKTYIEQPTGLDEQNIFVLSVAALSDAEYNYQDVVRDLQQIRQLPGVVDATFSMSSPLSNSGSSSDLSSEEDPEHPVSAMTDIVSSDSHALNALGLKLLAGRFFNDAEIVTGSPLGNNGTVMAGIVITRSLADKLYGKGVDPLGKLLQDAPVIGVVESAMVSYVAPDYVAGVAFLPRFISTYPPEYIIRCEPGALSQLMVKVPELLQRLDPNRMIRNVKPLTEVKDGTYRRAKSTVKMLVATMVLVASVTGLGIVGLTLLWGNRRRRQIGIRRALGASRSDIIRYFLTENLLITAVGGMVGIVLSIAVNQLMVQQYQMKALPISYILVTAVAVLILGLAAAMIPAWRSSLVSPALATRSV
ncbi:FtsX-like permease family protein [Shewanella yunxiaonensis]|uniref:FtsX-like permease family protein n=1 Tax=Shewanella yunxiaonensis TaxID=2829809 RepID=A0ABX7YR85_9GAMM|nr:FtsX-like permease family protein [Shewanella yunxiaonensis]QUN05237.1 FtsX-like permease family protein [Shewanella yunxiaonensis]